jgi:hypothetical protein
MECAGMNYDVMELLINAQIEKNPNACFEKAFCAAVECGRIDIARLISSRGLLTDFDALEPALTACRQNGFVDGVKLILEVVDERGRRRLAARPFLEKGIANSPEILRILFSVEQSFRYCLRSLVEYGDVEIVRIVLKRDSSPEYVNEVSEEGTALCVAVKRGHLEMVELLLSVPGINADLCDRHGRTPLVLAARFHYWGIMKALIDFCGDHLNDCPGQVNQAILAALTERGPEFDTIMMSEHSARAWRVLLNDDYPRKPKKDPDSGFGLGERWDPGMYAERTLTFECHLRRPVIETNLEKRWEVFRLLSAFSSFDPNCYDENGDTPLIMCSRDPDSLETIQLLTSHPKIDINFRNFRDQSAFTTAALKGNEGIMSFLSSCPDFDPEKSNVVLALAASIILGKTNQIAFILSLDFDINRAFIMKGALSGQYEVLATEDRKMSTALGVAIWRRDKSKFGIVRHPRFDFRKHELTEEQVSRIRSGTDAVW